MAVVVHPFLKDGVEARAYQMMTLRNAMVASTLMVMPTGFGKTAVEWMAMADSLLKNEGKILLIAPTTGLVEQQQRMARQMLEIDPDKIVTYTGDSTPDVRPSIWKEARIIMATSQVVRNDASNGTIDLSEIGLLIVDEAHHGTGNHAYAQVGNLYRRAREGKGGPKILGATASPGSNEKNIMEVIRNFDFDYLEASRKEDPMLQPYAVEMNTVPHRLPLPDELRMLIAPIRSNFDKEAKHLQDMGFLAPTGHISGKMINDAQNRASKAIQQRDRRGYDAARRIGDLRRMHILLDLLHTQGINAATAFLDRAEEDGRTGERATNRFVAKPAVHNFRIAAKDIDELHPKPKHVVELVQKQIHEHPESKIIVFTEYRDTVEYLVSILGSIENVLADKFIGQSGKGKRKGMTQKQQLAQLEQFREGAINVLVATSVGEEGLDVPAAELVILYEPVASAIRMIQRRGRTARQQDGTVHILIAQETRDEYVSTAAEKREEKMHRLLKRIKDRGMIATRPPASDQVFEAFTIKSNEGECSVPEFIEAEKEKVKQEIDSNDQVIERKDKQKVRTAPLIPATHRRHSQQMGLEQFLTPQPEQASKREIQNDVSPEKLLPILDGQAHRQKENLAAAAASATINELSKDADGELTIIMDHREASSTLGPYLRSLGATVVFKRLLQGDIRVSERILIERKTARDLVKSLTDGRLLHQCRRLSANAARPMLLVEIGEVHGQFVHPNAVHGALAHVSLDLGIPVMMTKNPEETAHFVLAAAKREHDMIERMASLAMSRAPQQDDERAIERAVSAAMAEIKAIELQEDCITPLADRWSENHQQEAVNMLSAISGIGIKKAESLIESFGNLSAVFSASVERLAECENIGKANAVRIFDVLHG
ncbi:MAG: hypothetical protein CL967_07035 [Euryarchaeota archaeon]|nr:hypothetical protein [Euryarchaeota archaeon]